MVTERAKLGKMLVDAKLISDSQLQKALAFQKAQGGKLGDVIVNLGFVNERTLVGFIAKQQGLPVVDLEELIIPDKLVKKIGRNLIERQDIVPIGLKNSVLTIATSDPFDFDALEELQFLQDWRIEINLAPKSAISKCIDELFGRKKSADAPTQIISEIPVSVTKDTQPYSKDATNNLFNDSEVQKALIPLLIEKGVITEAELRRKATELK